MQIDRLEDVVPLSAIYTAMQWCTLVQYVLSPLCYALYVPLCNADTSNVGSFLLNQVRGMLLPSGPLHETIVIITDSSRIVAI